MRLYLKMRLWSNEKVYDYFFVSGFFSGNSLLFVLECAVLHQKLIRRDLDGRFKKVTEGFEENVL